MTDQVQTEQPKLYAGKFKTIEELEEGYKNSARVYQEKQELAKKLDEVTKVPESYQIDSGVSLGEADKAELTALARNSGLTQQQFSKYVSEVASKRKAEAEAAEKARSEYGEKFDLVKDFVSKTYPQAVQDAVLGKAMKDKNAFESLAQQREQRLNSSIPGSGSISGIRTVSDDEVKKAYAEHLKYPNDIKKRDAYIELVKAYRASGR